MGNFKREDLSWIETTKWNNARILKDSLHTDVTFVLGKEDGKKKTNQSRIFKAHKAVVSSFSPLLRRLLDEDKGRENCCLTSMIERQVHLPDLNVQDFKMVLEMAYVGAPISLGNSDDVRRIRDVLNFLEVKNTEVCFNEEDEIQTCYELFPEPKEVQVPPQKQTLLKKIKKEKGVKSEVKRESDYGPSLGMGSTQPPLDETIDIEQVEKQLKANEEMEILIERLRKEQRENVGKADEAIEASVGLVNHKRTEEDQEMIPRMRTSTKTSSDPITDLITRKESSTERPDEPTADAKSGEKRKSGQENELNSLQKKSVSSNENEESRKTSINDGEKQCDIEPFALGDELPDIDEIEELFEEPTEVINHKNVKDKSKEENSEQKKKDRNEKPAASKVTEGSDSDVELSPFKEDNKSLKTPKSKAKARAGRPKGSKNRNSSSSSSGIGSDTSRPEKRTRGSEVLITSDSRTKKTLRNPSVRIERIVEIDEPRPKKRSRKSSAGRGAKAQEISIDLDSGRESSFDDSVEDSTYRNSSDPDDPDSDFEIESNNVEDVPNFLLDCQTCEDKFEGQDEILNHISRHYEKISQKLIPNLDECEKCEMNLGGRKSAKDKIKHFEVKHKLLETLVQEEKSAIEKWQMNEGKCYLCDGFLLKAEDVLYHYAKQHSKYLLGKTDLSRS